MAITVRHNGTGKGRRNATLGVVSLDYADMLDLISADGVPPCNASYHADATTNIDRRSDKRWYGGLASLDAAKELILAGWRDGASRASDMATGLVGAVPAPESIRRRWTCGDAGEALITERALSGDWETAWRRQTRVRSIGSKIVTLAANYGGNCHLSAEELFWTGVQLVVAVDLLEQSGYRVEAHALNATTYWGKDAKGILDVCVKQPEEPLRIDALMSLTAHAGVFRTYGFMGICRLPWDVTSALGSSVQPALVLPQAEEAGLIGHVDVTMPQAYNRDSAVRNIMDAIHAITGEPDHE